MTDVLPFEGAGGARKIYHQAHIMSAIGDLEKDSVFAAMTHVDKARLWPENLGAGKPYEVDERLEDYLEMIARNRLGQNNKADKILMRILDQTKLYKTDTGPNQIIGALALEQQGEHKEALSLLEKWAAVSPDTELAYWAVAYFKNDSEEKDRFYQKIKNRSDFQIYLKARDLK
jgi:tetratricopeptide (TPR) repeat protein